VLKICQLTSLQSFYSLSGIQQFKAQQYNRLVNSFLWSRALQLKSVYSINQSEKEKNKLLTVMQAHSLRTATATFGPNNRNLILISAFLFGKAHITLEDAPFVI